MLRSIVALACMAPALAASADPSKAWNVAKDNLPQNTVIVAGVDVATLAKSKLATNMLPMLLMAQPDVKKGFDLFTSECKLPPLQAINSIAIGTDATQKEGVAFVALQGVDRAKLTTCMQTVMKGISGAPVTVKQDGNVTEIVLDKGTFNLGWIGNDVAVVSLTPADKGKLRAWIGNKGAFGKSDAGKQVAKVPTGSTLWALSTASKQMDPQTTIKTGWFTTNYASGLFAAEIHAVLADATQATAAAAKLKEQLAKVPTSSTGLSDALKTVKISTTGPDLAIRAGISENDLLSVMMALGSM